MYRTRYARMICREVGVPEEVLVRRQPVVQNRILQRAHPGRARHRRLAMEAWREQVVTGVGQDRGRLVRGEEVRNALPVEGLLAQPLVGGVLGGRERQCGQPGWHDLDEQDQGHCKLRDAAGRGAAGPQMAYLDQAQPRQQRDAETGSQRVPGEQPPALEERHDHGQEERGQRDRVRERRRGLGAREEIRFQGVPGFPDRLVERPERRPLQRLAVPVQRQPEGQHQAEEGERERGEPKLAPAGHDDAKQRDERPGQPEVGHALLEGLAAVERPREIAEPRVVERGDGEVVEARAGPVHLTDRVVTGAGLR